MENEVNPNNALDGASAGGDYIHDPDAFGCCSRYRECSDAGKCLIPEAEYSLHCAYRKNLDKGTAFYGKKENAFSSARYEEIRRRVNALSADARAAFDALLIGFCEYHRAAQYLIIRNSFIEDLLSIGMFRIVPLGNMFFPDDSSKKVKWNFGKLKKLMSAYPDETALFEKAKEARKAESKKFKDEIKQSLEAAETGRNEAETERLEKLQAQWDKEHPGADSKEFLRSWLNGDGKPLRDKLSAPYRFVFLEQDERKYAEELYQETLVSSFDSRVYPLSALAEDELLTLSSREEEELRRVKLSHGYAREEKDRRIAEIEQARANRSRKRAAG